MKNPKTKIGISKKRRWLKRILITLAIIVLLPLGVFTIGWFNRDRVLDMVQEWYAENTSGTLKIGKVNARFLSGFPNLGFTFKDIHHTHRDSISGQVSSLLIEEAKMIIGAGNLLRGDFIFRRIELTNAIFTSEVISEKSIAYHQQLKRDKQADNYGLQFPKWINPKGAVITLKNVQYSAKDTILNKHFDVHVHNLKTAFNTDGDKLKGYSNIDLTVNKMGFNTTKGSFFKAAHITGHPKFSLNLTNETIHVPDFPLQIDAQTFQLIAKFDLSEATVYEFELKNPKTDFKAVKNLLNDSLTSKLNGFEIQKPFESSIKLVGKFAYGNNPDIAAEFSSLTNEITILDKFHLKNADFIGYLTNDIYTTDSLKTVKKTPKDIKVVFKSLNANLDDIEVKSQNSYYQSTPDSLNFIEASVSLKGSNETLAKIIETDNFDFKGGHFKLDAHISGDIPKPYEILNKSRGDFKLKNTHVILKKNGLQLPVQTISVALENENAILRELIVNLTNGEDLVFRGKLKNIAGLLSKSPIYPTTSQISLNSNQININDVITMAKSSAPPSKSRIDDRKDLYETLEAIYSQFHPQFDFNIGAMSYNDVEITDVKSKIELKDSETILLRNFNFNYDDAVTNLKGTMKVYAPESGLTDLIYMNAQATSEGSLAVFTDLFNIELFRIDSGKFKFNGKVNGNVRALKELLNNAQGDLTLTKTKLHYPPAKMDVVIDSLALYVNKSDILLEQFNIEIDELHSIELSGSIHKFPNFLLDDIPERGTIVLKATAPFFDGDELLNTINSFKQENNSSTLKSKKGLHTLFKDLNEFNPKIEIAIDSLKYKGLITENIEAQLNFENDSILKLNYLNLNYKESTAHIQGEINAHNNREELLKNNPFNLNFDVQVKGKSENLNDYLKTTNFVFKSGNFQFHGNYNGQAKNLTLLNSKSFGDLKIGGTLVDFEAADIQIPVDSLHLEIDNDLATLKTLDIQLPGKSSVVFEGTIDNFTQFIDGKKEDQRHSSSFSIYSPYLETTSIEEFLERSEATTKKREAKDVNPKKWKDIVRKINYSFYPTIDIRVDTLVYDNFSITNFKSGLLFDSEGRLNIEDTALNFYEGTMTINASVDLQNSENTPVTIEMTAKNLNLKELISRFDYFKNDDLRAAEHIAGLLNYSIIANGTVANNGQLNMDSLNGFLNLDLEGLEIYNYQPVMENVPLMKSDRFRNLRFRPIVQTFEIRNGEIIIPKTEIQSSAIHVFAEGRIKLKEHVNLWLSVPYRNLKSNDGLSLPEKTTYEGAGSKFFLQFVQDQNSKKARKQKLKVKIRLGNRKLRRMRDSLN
ncbi:AsmA-like C-terminal region-containing protein [Gelidibacter mesophilus]|uniref:AsmA-like C-terminal region-containing protein n=1 Tax=Gelidibacter mesophilus TaxID=169050 RepID=UPI0004180CF5|nr:AsmA-like C-terminal region-containing protein [Gelidibacter mesophilus]